MQKKVAVHRQVQLSVESFERSRSEKWNEKKWSGSGSWSVGSDLVWPVRKRLKLEVKFDVTGRSNDMTFVLLIEKLYGVRKV